jgi:hypothetical protein
MKDGRQALLPAFVWGWFHVHLDLKPYEFK